jgi:hypothetical protein
MPRSYVVLCSCIALTLTIGRVIAADDVECTRYVAAVGKIIRVPCDDGHAPADSGTSSDLAPAMHFTPAELDKVAPLRSQLTQLADALKAAEGDAGFRDSYCTSVAMASLVQSTRSRKEKKKLFDEAVVMQAKLGERGRLVNAAMTKSVIDSLLESPVNEASGLRLRHTPEGLAFIKVRDRFQIACSCLRDRQPPRRLICCDNCGLGDLKARLQVEQARGR